MLLLTYRLFHCLLKLTDKRKTGYPDSAAAETLNDVMIDVLDRKLAAARELDPDPIEQEDIHIQEIQLAGASSSGSEFEWEEG